MESVGEGSKAYENKYHITGKNQCIFILKSKSAEFVYAIIFYISTAA